MAPPSLVARRSAPPFEKLQLDREFCSVFRKYSPDYVRERALASPQDMLQVLLRLGTIVLRLGSFAAGLVFDNLVGEGDTPERCGAGAPDGVCAACAKASCVHSHPALGVRMFAWFVRLDRACDSVEAKFVFGTLQSKFDLTYAACSVSPSIDAFILIDYLRQFIHQ